MTGAPSRRSVCVCVCAIQADALEQEKKWLEDFIAKSQEAECNERLAEFRKKQAFREAIDQQVCSCLLICLK